MNANGMTTDPSNIILIVLDTLRSDKILRDYENKCLTPNIKRLLKNAIYFSDCIANSPWTVPSHISMFTGLYHSQSYNLNNNPIILSNKLPNLTEILKNLGYNTFCFTENPWINKKTGLSIGFDIVFNRWKETLNWIDKSQIVTQYTHLLNQIHSFIKKKMKSQKLIHYLDKVKELSEKLIKKIIKRIFWKEILFTKNSLNDLKQFYQILKPNLDKKPFYIYFNIMATHEPYIPIKSVLSYFNITKEDLRIIRKFLLNSYKYRLNLNLNDKYLSLKEIKIIKKLYNACVFFSDLIVADILTFLKNLKLLKNTYVIITSDHGEHLCDKLDHYLWEHNTYLSVYESVLRVPLIIFNENLELTKIENQVELKDLFHTILHLTGVQFPENKYLNKNKSLVYQSNSKIQTKYIFGEYIKGKMRIIKYLNSNRRFIKNGLIPKIKNDIFFVRSKTKKYIRYNEKIEEFYNLENDPNEQYNIANPNDEDFKEFRRLLEMYLIKMNDTKLLNRIINKKEKDLIKKSILSIKKFKI